MKMKTQHTSTYGVLWKQYWEKRSWGNAYIEKKELKSTTNFIPQGTRRRRRMN